MFCTLIATVGRVTFKRMWIVEHTKCLYILYYYQKFIWICTNNVKVASVRNTFILNIFIFRGHIWLNIRNKKSIFFTESLHAEITVTLKGTLF